MCSEKIEKYRLRRATREPPLFQNVESSGDQSSIQRPLRACVPGGGASGRWESGRSCSGDRSASTELVMRVLLASKGRDERCQRDVSEQFADGDGPATGTAHRRAVAGAAVAIVPLPSGGLTRLAATWNPAVTGSP